MGVMAMKCPKCGGLMNFETFISTDSETGPWSYEGWHCIYCGEIIDPLVILNREKSKLAEGTELAAGPGPKREKVAG
jgi:hypothetical protein